MRFAALFCLLTCLPCTPPVTAGPWLQEKGSGFAALSLTATSTDHHGLSAYLEYGATAETTLGIDIDLNRDALKDRSGYGTLFLRRALWPSEGPDRFAYELGLGVARKDGHTTPTAKTALTWGRGIALQGRSGWVTVDGALIWDLRTTDTTVKLDGTLGLNLSDVMAAMLQVNYSHMQGDGHGKVEPSLILRPNAGDFRIKIGAQAPIDDLSETALTLGLWHDF